MYEYGIRTSKAHFWVHVCAKDAGFYLYRRRDMVAKLHQFDEKVIATAIGRVVPVHANLVQNGGLLLPFWLTYEWFDAWDWAGAPSDDALGKFAEAAFLKATREKLIAFPAWEVTKHDDIAEQYQGRDFRVRVGSPLHAEVKADYQGGQWGTGKLFVQTHEQNHRHRGRLLHRNHWRDG